MRWIQRCANQSLAFRTPADGWLTSACGGLYRSRDGGHHWIELDQALPPLSLVPPSGLGGPDLHYITWLDEQIGLIVGPRGFVVRSADGGRSWQRRALPASDSAFRLEHAGATVWICDSESNLFRSDDAGDSWRRLAQLPSKFGCYGLSFADGDYGWLTDTRSSQLWATSDGGASWSEVSTPPNLHNPEPLRLTRDLGWLIADGRQAGVAYRTSDGGRHWTQAPLPPPSSAAVLSRLRIDGRERELTAAAPIRSSADLDHVTPLPPHESLTRLDEHTSVRLDRGLISWYRDGQNVGRSSLLSPPSGKTERLAGVVPLSSGHARWGWTDRHVYRSDGDGAPWFVVADTPAPFERIILLDDASALARSRAGKLYASSGWFDRWRATTDPMDRWEWSRRVPGGGPVASPAACLATANRGALSVSVVERACFDSRASELELHWSGANVAQRVSASDSAAATSTHPTRAGARALIAQVVAILDGTDEEPACDSTSSIGVIVKWQCGSAPQREARFSAPRCGDDRAGATRGGTRADALLDVVQSWQ